MKNRIAAIVAGAALALSMSSAPAFATQTGTMTVNEFQSICTPDMNITTGCTRALYQGEVEGSGSRGCDCTGNVVTRWTGSNGGDHKQVQYINNLGLHSYVSYIYRTGSDKWQVTDKSYCDFWGCYPTYPN